MRNVATGNINAKQWKRILNCIFTSLLRFEIRAGSLSLGCMRVIAPLHSELEFFFPTSLSLVNWVRRSQKNEAMLM